MKSAVWGTNKCERDQIQVQDLFFGTVRANNARPHPGREASWIRRLIPAACSGTRIDGPANAPAACPLDRRRDRRGEVVDRDPAPLAPPAHAIPPPPAPPTPPPRT